MITITSFSFSSNPAAVSQAVLVAVAVTETQAAWTDVKAATWSGIKGSKPNDWEQIRDKWF